MDCRGCYTAMATLRLLKMDPAAVVARAGMVDFIRRCQASSAVHSCRRTFSFRVPGCSECLTYLFEGQTRCNPWVLSPMLCHTWIHCRSVTDI